MNEILRFTILSAAFMANVVGYLTSFSPRLRYEATLMRGFARLPARLSTSHKPNHVPFGSLVTMQPALLPSTWSIMRLRKPGSLRASVDDMEGKELSELVDKATTAAESQDEVSAVAIPSSLAKALRKPSGALSLVVDFQRDDMLLHSDVYKFSHSCRKGNCVAITVRTDVEDGQLDLESFVRDQRKAEGKFPGPCYIINGMPITTVEQAVLARLSGASAVTLNARTLSVEDLTKRVRACHALGLECVVEISSVDDVKVAMEARAKIVCIRDVEGLEEALSLLENTPKELVRLVAVPAMQAQCGEVAQCSVLRTAGCDGILLEGAGRDADVDGGYVTWAAETIGGKKSTSFSFGTITGAVEEKREAKWSRLYRERNPSEWEKWQKYRKTRDYQIRAQIWGQ